MPQYEIEQYELHVQKYRVEAATEAVAIAKLYRGEAEPVDGTLDFIEVAEDFGLPADEYPDLAEALRGQGVSVDDVVPSVRSVEEV